MSMQELVTHMENELERKREAFEESAKKINESSQETMREVMESFASKVAVHLSITGAAGGGGGGGASEELMADIGKQMQSVKKEIASKNETLVEMLQELDTTLKINAKRASRSQLGSRGGDGLANDPRMSSHPGVVAPLPPEEMDAIKADLHFAVAGAMKNVLDEHRGGVVLLNLPDHNKPAGFMHGDGAGMLHHTIIENMREQKVLHSKLADDMDEIRLRFGKLEEKMHIQLSSMKQSAGGAVIDKQPKAATKLLYAVQNQNGSQASIESRLLPRSSILLRTLTTLLVSATYFYFTKLLVSATSFAAFLHTLQGVLPQDIQNMHTDTILPYVCPSQMFSLLELDMN